MTKHLLIFCCLFWVGNVFAQNRTVTGRVTAAADGSALPGVNILVKGTTNGTASDSDGNYRLNVPDGTATLVFSYVGFLSREVAVGSRNVLDIALDADVQALSEVVVTAYGSTQKRAFTGSASTIGSEQVKRFLVSSPASLLQGNASGVQVVGSSGQPGESAAIRIRGIGSLNASADPLIIVDGAQYGGNFASINPNDIDNITVLKDASSTALYGSRAANGVIVITTKTGKGKPKISVNLNTGISSRAVDFYDFLSTQQLFELGWEALRNDARNSLPSGYASPEQYATKNLVTHYAYNPYSEAEPVDESGRLKPTARQLWNDSWKDELIRTGKRQQADVTISGGTDKTRYLISAGLLNDDGIVIASNFKRYTGRTKVESQLNNWLTAGLNTNLAYSTQNFPQQSGSAYSNVVQFINTVPDLYPVYVRNPSTGDYIRDANGGRIFDFGDNGPVKRPSSAFTPANPVGTTRLNERTYDRFVTSGNLFTEIAFLKELKLRTQYSIDHYLLSDNDYYNPFFGDGANYGGRSNKKRNTTIAQTLNNTLTYDKFFGTDHHLNVLAGTEVYKFNYSYVAAEKRGFSFPGLTELNYGSTLNTADSYSAINRLESYFSRLNYDLKNRYYLSLSLRRDGTTRFAKDSRWGTFYSVGAAWSIADENFLKESPAVSAFKLRASYGTSGNQFFMNSDPTPLPLYFPYLGTYETGQNVGDFGGVVIQNLGNMRLTWETQKQTDIGVDFGFFKNRLSGSFTYFNRVSDNLLFFRPLPNSTGVSGINDNVGEFKNYGIEFDLTSVNIARNGFEWRTSLNLSAIRNKITRLPQESIVVGNKNRTVGKSVYEFYVREFAGINKEDGTPQWYKDDADGKRILTGTYSEATRYFAGSSLPKFNGGLTNTLSYKGVTLSVMASFSVGGKISDRDYAALFHGFSSLSFGRNGTPDMLNRWQSPENPGDGKTPVLTSEDLQHNLESTLFLFDATYARIRNINLSYSLPQKWISWGKIGGVTVYGTAQNPFTFFGRKGLDPEQGFSGTSDQRSGALKTFSLGINVDL